MEHLVFSGSSRAQFCCSKMASDHVTGRVARCATARYCPPPVYPD
jgi:hypothetical protein